MNISKSENKVVTPLAMLLMNSDMEQLCDFMQRLGIRYTIQANIPRKQKQESGYFCTHKCSIIVNSEEKYVSRSGKSVKGALTNAMAAFLALEEHDYHDYIKASIPNVGGPLATYENESGVVEDYPSA